MAALLAWLWLASPAGAAIQRFTDSRGVIHISNGAANQPAPVHPGSTAGELGPEMASLPEAAAPPVNAVAEPQPTPATTPPQTRETSFPVVSPGPDVGEKSSPALDAAGQVCQTAAGGEISPPGHVIVGLIAAAASAAAKSVTPAAAAPAATAAAENTSESEPGAPKPMAYEAAEAEVEAGASPMPAPQRPAPKAAAMITAGSIVRHRDAQGVWHITNVTPEAAGAGPAWLEAAKAPVSEKATPEKPTPGAATVTAGLPLQKASWSPDASDLVTLPTTASRVRTTAASLNVIRRYRDSKGVIHIDNVEPGTSESLPAGVQVRGGPEGGAGPPERRFPSPVEGSAPSALKRVAWSGEEGLKLPKPSKARSAPGAAITTEGGIKRWRDQKGIWHIETVEYPLPPGVVLHPRLGGPNPVTLAARTPAPASAAPGPPPGVSAAAPVASGPPRVPTITAFRDARGRLKITNDAPFNLGKPPPAGAAPAPAELEPLIVEAAQVHRLPATLIRAVIKTESDFCSWAVSPKGAMGLMQLMPGTAAFLGVAEPFNPRENVHGGCRYLRLLIDSFGGNLPLALAAYNAGYQRVIDCGFQVPNIKETQDFVTVVMGRYMAEEHRAGQPWT